MTILHCLLSAKSARSDSSPPIPVIRVSWRRSCSQTPPHLEHLVLLLPEVTTTDESREDPDSFYLNNEAGSFEMRIAVLCTALLQYCVRFHDSTASNQNMAPHLVFHVFNRILKQYKRVLRAHSILLALAQRQSAKVSIIHHGIPQDSLSSSFALLLRQPFERCKRI